MQMSEVNVSLRLELEGVDTAIEQAERLLEVLRRLKEESADNRR